MHSTFQKRLEKLGPALSPAEQRVAQVLMRRRNEVLLASAAQIAQMSQTSDATVVRTARALGYAGLAQMRKSLLADHQGDGTPADRLARTLDAAREEGGSLLTHTLDAHAEALAVLRAPAFAEKFEAAAGHVADAERLFIFGLGPSAALAQYCAVQLGRLSIDCRTLSLTGIGLADQLGQLGAKDHILMLAYAPIYREAEIVIQRAKDLDVPVALITDNALGCLPQDVRICLEVARGRTDHFALHGATLVLLEALIAAAAARRGAAALSHLAQFAQLRGDIDKNWIKRRGAKPRRTNEKDQS